MCFSCLRRTDWISMRTCTLGFFPLNVDTWWFWLFLEPLGKRPAARVSLPPSTRCQGSDVVPSQLPTCGKRASQSLCSHPIGLGSNVRDKEVPTFQPFPAPPVSLDQALAWAVMTPISLSPRPATSGRWLDVVDVPKGLGDKWTSWLCHSQLCGFRQVA